MSIKKKIQVAIADDYSIFREGLKKCIAADKSLEVIIEAGNGSELISEIEKKMPDVIIMDLKMPVMDGIQATPIIKKKFPGVKILVVTMYGEDEFIIRLMDMGANGYLLKNSEPEEIRRSVHSVYENGYYFNDRIKGSLLKKLAAMDTISPAFNKHIHLAAADREVLKLMAGEKNEEQIAKQIGTSTAGVHEIQKQLMEKTGVRNLAGLVVYAIKNGITN